MSCFGRSFRRRPILLTVPHLRRLSIQDSYIQGPRVLCILSLPINRFLTLTPHLADSPPVVQVDITEQQRTAVLRSIIGIGTVGQEPTVVPSTVLHAQLVPLLRGASSSSSWSASSSSLPAMEARDPPLPLAIRRFKGFSQRQTRSWPESTRYSCGKSGSLDEVSHRPSPRLLHRTTKPPRYGFAAGTETRRSAKPPALNFARALFIVARANRFPDQTSIPGDPGSGTSSILNFD